MLRQPFHALARFAVLLAGAVGVSGCRPPSVWEQPGPTITVEAAYPGASAEVVADTVAAPVEQQVNGVERMVSMRSQCKNDGLYRLMVTFDGRADLNLSQVLVQNRVALALPMLPDAVKAPGVTVKKTLPVLLILSLSVPEGKPESLSTANDAAGRLRDEIARLPGVGDVTLLGNRARGIRFLLDPEKMERRGITAGDVARAMERENAVPKGGQETEIHVTPEAAEQLGDLVLKTDAAGRVIRLKDVARIEVGGGQPRNCALRGGKPVVALPICPLSGARPRQVSDTVRGRLPEIKAALPKGVALDIVFDFTPNLDTGSPSTPDECLLIDLASPATPRERVSDVLHQCGAALRGFEGLADVLTLLQNPLDPARNQRVCWCDWPPLRANRVVERTSSSRFATGWQRPRGFTFWLRDLSGSGGFPRRAYPVDLALYGPEQDRVADVAKRLAERLRKSTKLTDVWAGGEAVSQLYFDIDRPAATKNGVLLADVVETIQVGLEGLSIGDASGFGRTWQVVVEPKAGSRGTAEDIKRLKIRNARGEMIPLAKLVAIRENKAPAVVDRLDLYPMVEITANPAPGVSLEEIRTLCETLTKEICSSLGQSVDCRLKWF